MAPLPPKKSGTTSVAAKFQIPDVVKQKYPELVSLIMETESMQDEERQYWFSILPIMTDEQVARLREILLNEKDQLKKLDDEYTKEIKRVNEEQLLRFREVESKEKWTKIRTAEKSSEEQEKTAEEAVLKKLQEL